mmetsp:Transcript_63519/g.102918  ORF Transcript_63519/g.102918 Transcript_63519/m.102918 type:complete len:86 (-) Transcript_63519:13-270(-)
MILARQEPTLQHNSPRKQSLTLTPMTKPQPGVAKVTMHYGWRFSVPNPFLQRQTHSSQPSGGFYCQRKARRESMFEDIMYEAVAK